jgi:uncharacterized protein YndB with AHSA1/START domain
MILRVVILIAVLIAGLLVFAATRPNTFRIQRSTTIAAPPEKIFALLDDFHNWPRWAPQDREDPSIKRIYSGAESGVGAISEWSGSGSTGAGRMSIIEADPPGKVTVKVDFLKPVEAHNINQFVLEPAGGTTVVTWSMHGSNLYMMKLMSIFTDMDKLMGKHFESGLQNLKVAAEK